MQACSTTFSVTIPTDGFRRVSLLGSLEPTDPSPYTSVRCFFSTEAWESLSNPIPKTQAWFLDGTLDRAAGFTPSVAPPRFTVLGPLLRCYVTLSSSVGCPSTYTAKVTLKAIELRECEGHSAGCCRTRAVSRRRRSKGDGRRGSGT